MKLICRMPIALGRIDRECVPCRAVPRRHTDENSTVFNWQQVWTPLSHVDERQRQVVGDDYPMTD